jgi:hypothetical protein
MVMILSAGFVSDCLIKLTPNNGFMIDANEFEFSEDNYDKHVIYNNPPDKPDYNRVLGYVPDTQWESVRVEQKYKLEDSDWTVLPDVPMEESLRNQWKVYRQELRDITTQPDPFNITWPTPPE